MTELPLKDDMTKSAIDYLEKQGYSVIEWIDFDVNDKSTWPNKELSNGTHSVDCIDGNGCFCYFSYKTKTWRGTNRIKHQVKKYAYLSQPREK